MYSCIRVRRRSSRSFFSASSDAMAPPPWRTSCSRMVKLSVSSSTSSNRASLPSSSPSSRPESTCCNRPCSSAVSTGIRLRPSWLSTRSACSTVRPASKRMRTMGMNTDSSCCRACWRRNATITSTRLGSSNPQPAARKGTTQEGEGGSSSSDCPSNARPTIASGAPIWQARNRVRRLERRQPMRLSSRWVSPSRLR
ncbi:hypothetical protein D9M71_554450 [compost metagenome]